MRTSWKLASVGVFVATLSGCGMLGEWGSRGDSQAGGSAAAGGVSFEKADANKDGRISRSEAQGNATLSDRFAKLDKDNDGSLSRSEFKDFQGAAGAAGGGEGGEE